MFEFFSSGKNKMLLKAGVILLIFFILLLLPGRRNSIDYSFEQLYSLSAGQPKPDTNIVIIHITAEDIERIGPWPVKRSYYALLINSLSKYGVKKIGLEIFLSSRLVTQAIYDNLLTREIERAGNVVLSSVSGRIEKENRFFVTDSMSFPTPKLINDNAQTGHINFIDEEGIIIPIKIYGLGNIEKAFSHVLAGNENISLPDTSEITINLFNSWKNFKTYSLLEYFDLVQNADSSLYQLKDKIVLIGASDPQIAPIFKSYFEDDIPGVALHAFALDNILNYRSFNTSTLLPSKIIFILFVVFIMFIQHKMKWGSVFFYFIIFTLFVFVTFVMFKFFHTQLSYSSFILPLAVLIVTDFIISFADKKNQLKISMDEGLALRNTLIKKENELKLLENELNMKQGDNQPLIDKVRALKDQIEKLRKDEDDSEPAIINASAEIKRFEGIVYKSKMMDSIVDLIKKVAPEDATILILGESGTGKELAARAIHLNSRRKNENFITVNCGAISETLLESELFGHVKGAFTGASADKIGRFQAADKGTIFLDEIAETSENFQVKLLRVIQSGDFEKVGSSKTEHVDVRIVAATNKDLEAHVKEKKFREDLYYRLNIIKIELPPLRERMEDIEALAHHFISKENNNLIISNAALEALQNYEWKGNIRELESVIKRAAIFAKTSGRKLIQLIDLPQDVVKESKYSFDDLVMESLRNKKFSHSSIIETAKELGNVNRTLVSENFRGRVFKTLVENNFYEAESIIKISGTDDESVNEKVRLKMQTFTNNIQNDIHKTGTKNFDEIKTRFASKYKNLPQKFHFYLDEVIRHYLSKM